MELEEKFKEKIRDAFDNNQPYLKACVKIAEDYAIGFHRFANDLTIMELINNKKITSATELIKLYNEHLKTNEKGST